MDNDIVIGPGSDEWEEAREIVRSIAVHAIAIRDDTFFDPLAHDDLERIAYRLAANVALAASTVWIAGYWFAFLFNIAGVVVASDPSDAVAAANATTDEASMKKAARQAYESIEETLAADNF